jgi:CSLREA domain-containing protein
VVVRPAAIAAACAVAALALPGAAHGAAISVTTADDAVAADGACSLREAVAAANTDNAANGCPAGSGADQIALGGTLYKLTAGQLDVTSEFSITGTGAASTTIDGNHNGRVLNVTAAGKLTLDSVGVTGGLTGSGGAGSAGASHDPAVPGSGGAGGNGGNGGGIANAGTLTITSSRVFANSTGNGGDGGDGTGSDGTSVITHGGSGIGGAGGTGGNGGGVYSTGTLTITSSTIDGNVTGGGGTGGDGTGGLPFGTADAGVGTGGPGGQGGSGGGVYAAGTPTVTGSTISGNTTGSGGPAGNGHGHDGVGAGNAGEGKGGTGGQGGSGGGVWFDTTLSAFDDTVSGNTTGGGNLGGIGFGGNAGTGSAGKGTGGNGGRGGDGGAIAGGRNTTGNLDLERSLLLANHTGGGSGGGSGFPGAGATAKGGNGGNGGGGGGLDNAAPLAFAINVTFTGNTTGDGGNRGTGPPPSPDPSTFGKGGDGGNGAAAHGRLGTLGLLQTTVIGNSVGSGGGGSPPGATGSGSLVRETPASFGVGNSILDGMCFAMSDSGGNLVLPSAIGCPGTVGDPKLGPLQDNGGPTRTMAIGTSGDAIDKLAPASNGQCAAAVDQRGATRPSLVRCDIGAYEVAPPVATTGDASQVGATSAKAGGTLDPRGLRTRWHVEYGTSSSYGGASADQFAGGGATDVGAILTGLSPQTTYHYRLVAVGPDGTSTGADRTFTTTAKPPPGGGLGTAPKITGLTLKPKKFRVSGKKPLGTRITYTNTLAAVTTFTVLRPARGVRVKGTCLRPTKKRHGKRCTRYVAVGRFTHIDKAGANAFRWGGKAGGHKLGRGSYKLRAVPVTGVLAGNAVTISFRVVR